MAIQHAIPCGSTNPPYSEPTYSAYQWASENKRSYYWKENVAWSSRPMNAVITYAGGVASTAPEYLDDDRLNVRKSQMSSQNEELVEITQPQIDYLKSHPGFA